MYAVSRHLVAKLYRRPVTDSGKLIAMLERPPVASTGGRATIAWPVDLLVDETDRVVGFLMPRAKGRHTLVSCYNPANRLRHFPRFHYRTLLEVAANLAAAVEALHTGGYVVGDLNPANVLVSEQGEVTLVDADSFQVRCQDGRTYGCGVGRPEYTPPELQGLHLAGLERTVEHDRFALAVLIFHLLMEGTHPFAGTFAGEGEPPSIPQRIAWGYFPHAPAPLLFKPPPFAPDLSLVPPSLVELFQQCFVGGFTEVGLRPGARQWRIALETAARELVGCPTSRQHFYGDHLQRCPWCARRSLLGGHDPFARTRRRRRQLPVLSIPAGRLGLVSSLGRQIEQFPQSTMGLAIFTTLILIFELAPPLSRALLHFIASM